jgi:hypothetical protein
MNYTGYTVLKVPKTGAAFAYAKEARQFATGATGAGGYLNSAKPNFYTNKPFKKLFMLGILLFIVTKKAPIKTLSVY